MTGWSGVFPAVTTKFTQRSHPRFSRPMETHFAWLIQSGVDGLITTGSLGEASTLTPEEKLEVARIAICRVGGASTPVLATVAETTTAGAVALRREGRGLRRRGSDGAARHAVCQRSARGRDASAHRCSRRRPADHALQQSRRLPRRRRSPRAGGAARSEAKRRRDQGILRRRPGASPTSAPASELRFRIFAGVDNLALESFQMGADGWVAGLVNAFPEETVADLPARACRPGWRRRLPSTAGSHRS